MKFSVEHEFSASRALVVDVLCDPEFQTALDLPDLSRAEVVEHSVDGATRVLRLRYEFVGHLDPVARKIIGGRKLTWVQDLEVDTSDYKGRLSFAAEADAQRLFGAADVAIDAIGSDGRDERSRRRIAGDLHVKVPLIGGTAEKRIVPGLVRRLDIEAEELEKELARRGA